MQCCVRLLVGLHHCSRSDQSVLRSQEVSIFNDTSSIILSIDRLKKLIALQNEDEQVKEERAGLTDREKDEGDYFGVRALEAGFYAGVAQSAPTSRANSVIGSPLMSNSTLVGGGLGNFKDSPNNSVTALPLAHTREPKNSTLDESEALPSPQSEEPSRRRSPPAIRLAPSTAELTGRHRFSAGIDMNLRVPPSPSVSRGPSSPTFGGSDGGESDGALSPVSPMGYYAPNAPQPPSHPEGFSASSVSGPAHPSMATPDIKVDDSGTQSLRHYETSR